MFKRITSILLIVILLCGCSSKEKQASFISTLNDVEITFRRDLTINNSIPLTFMCDNEVNDLRIYLQGDSSLKYSHDIQLVKKETLELSHQIPWFVWVSQTDFDWEKQKEAYKIEMKDTKKLAEWEQYLQPYQAEYDKVDDKNEVLNYTIYSGYIYIDDLFTCPDTKITSIKICDGEEVLKEIDVNIDIKTESNEQDGLQIIFGNAMIGAKSFPSIFQTYVSDYVLKADEDITLKEITMYDKDLEIVQLQMRVDGKEYIEINPNQINMDIRKGTEFVIHPEVRSKDINHHSIYTRNYIYQVKYEQNGEEKLYSFDSGVITSDTNYDQLYYLQTNEDYSAYLDCILFQETFDDRILIE